MTEVNLMLGDCLDRLKDLEDNSVDSIVTDPPYGLSFMGKAWDKSVPSREVWEECLRVLKPGGYLLAFAGTRTQHRMAVNIEDAGFEIRDMIAWVYGSGFPKSLDISKALDKMAGAERKVVGTKAHLPGYRTGDTGNNEIYGKGIANGTAKCEVTEPATEDAKKWEGWGTALKPALEPITVARKPLAEKNVASNVLKYGTGGINIDESRVPANGDNLRGGSKDKHNFADKEGWDRPWMHDEEHVKKNKEEQAEKIAKAETLGRYPANLIHDGSDDVLELFPENSGRFFYVPKTSKKDRNEGLDDFEEKSIGGKGNGIRRYCSQCGVSILESHLCECEEKDWVNPATKKNNHPTVKPTDLMRYLVRMVTPKGGTTLDPFMGSGSTGKAAKLEGFSFIGIELESDYLEIARARIDSVQKESNLEDFFK